MNRPLAPGGLLQRGLGSALSPEPPSLRRRAPARLDLTTKSGMCLPMTRERVHLRAGHTILLQVVPQFPPAKVTIESEPPLQKIMGLSLVEGAVPTYHAEYTGRSPLRIMPLPATGELHVCINDGWPDPCRVTIPVTIWPSYSTVLVWWLLAFLGIVGLRWQKTAAESDSVSVMLSAMWRDVPYLLGILALGLLLLIPLRVIGWLIALAESGDAHR